MAPCNNASKYILLITWRSLNNQRKSKVDVFIGDNQRKDSNVISNDSITIFASKRD